MKLNAYISRLVMAVAVAGMILPHTAASAATPDAVVDVALQAGGTLQGRLVTPEGQVLGHKQVAVTYAGQTVATTETGEDGSFVFHGLRGGAHVLNTNGAVATCRFWSNGTAPPAAHSAVLMVDTTSTVRAQGPCTSCGAIGGCSCSSVGGCTSCGGAGCSACGGRRGILGGLISGRTLLIGAGAAAVIWAIADDDDDAATPAAA
ncbi:MAG: hypothetical protein R3E01_23725 [Pirellulaceae bacterium]|nr:hypothetical protein [Planctomycetales bacterium]